jgi:NAD(P)-dependent dehydrogenase (short-subunit alcohol dehydrogenase family)
MAEREVAVVVGVGPGLGQALVRHFAAAGLAVAAAARTPESLAGLAGETGARAYRCDASDEAQVETLFAAVAGELGVPGLVVHNPSHFVMKPFLDLEAAETVRAWRVACLGGFLVGRTAARAMVERGQGTILFTGSTPSVKAMAQFAAFAAAKFGVRALAQSMARELGAKGIHVAHILVDGPIDGPGNEAVPADRRVKPADIAEAFLQIHRQPRSAWTQELDLRPAAAKF